MELHLLYQKGRFLAPFYTAHIKATTHTHTLSEFRQTGLCQINTEVVLSQMDTITRHPSSLPLSQNEIQYPHEQGNSREIDKQAILIKWNILRQQSLQMPILERLSIDKGCSDYSCRMVIFQDRVKHLEKVNIASRTRRSKMHKYISQCMYQILVSEG